MSGHGLSQPAVRFEVFGLPGIPEVRPGDDLVELMAPALAETPLADGDIVVVTSKIVSKAEGRLLTGVDRDEAIDAESVRTVSEWTTPHGRARIVETRHGFVMAAAGVDASNVEPGVVVLLPLDPDASARRLRDGLARRHGVRVGVVVTDTAGRPWRAGVTDFAVGAAGVRVVDDLRGLVDGYGNELGVTVVALADELAAASELVRTKLSGMPVAVVRGLSQLVLENGSADGDTVDPGAAALIRSSAEDRFRLGTPEAIRAAVHARRVTTDFAARPVDLAAVQSAAAAALAATGSDWPEWRFVLVESTPARRALADALDSADGVTVGSDGRIGGVADSAVVTAAPCVVVPCAVNEASPTAAALLALGMAVADFLVTLGADGLASAWVGRAADPEAVAMALDLPADWTPTGAICVGYPARPDADDGGGDSVGGDGVGDSGGDGDVARALSEVVVTR